MTDFTQVRKQLLRWITETQVALSVPDGPYDDLWRLGFHDTLEALRLQVALLDQIIFDPALQTREALVQQFRVLFAKYDALHGLIEALPNFDHVGDGEEFEVDELPEDEREQYDQVTALHHENFVNMHQHELLADLLGIDSCRIHDLRHIIGAHYERTRSVQRQEAAGYYPMVKHWIDNGGDVMSLSIPEKFSSWLRKVEVQA
jgi:hypothetical protein